MKPIKKKTAKIFIALIVVAAVIGSIFCFVPMSFNSFTFTSISGAINVSSELGAGVYAEYDLNGDYTDTQISKSISTIKEVLSDKGYPSADIYAIGNEKIRIEIGYPTKGETLKNSYTLLNAVGIGVFELRSSSAEKDTYIVGKEHIDSVDIQTYNGGVYVVLNFNESGLDFYEQLLEASDTIYVCMGGETMTSFDSSKVVASTSMPLSFNDYASAEDFAMKVKLGSLDVELNPDTVCINTMSSILTNAGFVTNPNNAGFGYSATKVACIVALVAVVLFALVLMIVKFGIIALFQAVAVLFNVLIALLLMWGFPWVEINFASILALAFGFAIMFTLTTIFALRFNEEYKLGKTVNAAFESAYKKSLSGILAIGIALTVIFGVVAIVASAELKVFGLITCVFSMLALFGTLVMVPGFMNIFETFNDGSFKPYRLPNREDK